MLHRIALIIAFLAAPIFAESQSTTGNYRFTVITPNLIRIEHSPAKKFLDEPTYFAVDRKARFDAKIVREPQSVVIDTGVIQLECKDIGGPPMPLSESLRATIRHNGKKCEWTPGQKQTANLGGTIQTLDQVTGPVPLGEGVLSRDGWYLLDDTDRHVLKNNWIAPREKEEGAFDWYLFGYGRDYKAALKSLTAISGPVPMPRKYALGAWYSRYWPYTSADYRQIVKEYHDNGFPLDVIVLDMDWHITDVPKEQGGGWTGFSWDRKLLPDAEELLKWFKEQNLAVTLNLHPMEGIRKHDTAFEPFMKELGLDPAKDAPPKFDIGDRKYVEAFFKHGHNPLEDAGVDFWWMDWQQDGDMPFVPSVPGLRHMPWLNQLYFQQSQRKGLRGMSFSRWGGWGDHRHPIHFSGDAGTNWESLAFQIPFTSTAGNVGCFFWSHDIGGHMGARNEESYARWCQFGALSAALRSHSTRDEKMDRRPWKYEKWATDSMRKSFRLRSELFPYIYSSVAQSCRESIPLIRPMYLEYPEDEEAYRNPQQYMFGDHLLVAPITMPGVGPRKVAWQVVWFPPGEWFNFFTGEKYTGPSTQIVAADIDEFPLFARAGAPIPMQAFKERMSAQAADDLVIRLFPGSAGVTKTTLLDDDGVTRTAENRRETDITYSRDDKGGTSVQVSPTRGDNAQSARTVTLEFAGAFEIKDLVVTHGAQPVKFESKYQQESLMNRVVVAGVDNKSELVFEFREIESVPDPMGAPAILASITSSDRRLGSLIETERWDARVSILGVALITRSDSPTTHGGREWIELIASKGIAVGPGGTLQLRGAPASADVEVIAGKPIELAGLVRLLSPADSISKGNATIVLSVRVSDFRKEPVELSTSLRELPHAPNNLSATAAATASSSEPGYDPKGAIDNAAAGYPLGRQYEWASHGEKAGAKLKLSWKAPVTASQVFLFDRPNKDDQVKSAVLRFSDGSTARVGELQNTGEFPYRVHFPAKTFDWVELEITEVSATTRNAGIAEMAVFQEK